MSRRFESKWNKLSLTSPHKTWGVTGSYYKVYLLIYFMSWPRNLVWLPFFNILFFIVLISLQEFLCFTSNVSLVSLSHMIYYLYVNATTAKPFTPPVGIYVPKSLKCWAETEFQHTRCLICRLKGLRIAGWAHRKEEKKRRIDRLLFS